MTYIPIIVTPYPDELLYSWIQRLAKLNCLSISNFRDAYLGGNNTRISTLPYDVRREYPYLYRGFLSHDRTLVDLYLDVSTYGFESMFLDEGAQTRYLNNAFFDRDELNPPVNSLIQNVRVCEECIREDRDTDGEAYLHRAHQYSGVCTCNKHRSILKEYHGKKGHELEFVPENWGTVKLVAEIDSLNAYTEYTMKLANASVSCNIMDLRQYIYDSLSARDERAINDYAGFCKEFLASSFSDLFPIDDIEKFLKVKLIAGTYVIPQEIIPILMVLDPTAQKVIEHCKKNKPSILELTCEQCEHTYCVTPQAIKQGWGCPECERQESVQTRFRKLVTNTAEGHYKALDDYTSFDRKIAFYHDVCGKTVQMKPRSFLFEGTRCMCEWTTSEKEAKEKIEAHKGFKLVKFTGTEKPVTILHEECGREFTCRYRKFLKFPGCRQCNPSFMTTEIYKQRVKDLVGDEYSVVNGFENQKVPVAIRHNSCGIIQQYKPSSFLNGQRCRNCSFDIERKPLEELLEQYAGERYKILSYDRNLCDIMDNREGKIIRLSPAQIVQEIERPTPSEELPSDQLHKTLLRYKSIWERNYDLLLKYKEETGSSSVPKCYMYQGINLGLWCQHQRDYRKKGKLREHRIQLLDNIGFIWDPLEDEWMRRYDQYRRFITEKGTTNISRRTDYEGEHLGAWVEMQRKYYVMNKLSDKRIALLSTLDVEFFNRKK